MASDTAKKPKAEKIITPKGTMIYPWLNKPDTKWKEEGEYRVTLKVDADAAAPLLKKIDAMYAAALKKAKANPKHKNKKVKEQEVPYSLELDDDGNETGHVLFKFKRRASGVKKDGTPWAIKPDLFDSKGEKLDPSIQVWGGSVGKVSFTAEPYDTPIGAGLSLRLEGVQVIKVVEGSGRSAESYGFGNESDDDDDTDDESDDESADADESDDDDMAGDEF